MLYCLLFLTIILFILADPAVNPEVVKSRKDNVFRMAAFCDNKVDCRRSLQLKYFGEHFSRDQCLKDKRTACDNCLGKGAYSEVDCIQLAKEVVNCVKTVCGLPRGHARFTQLHFIDILKGSKNSKILGAG
jgi:bloom syndrome protein